eukprot:g20236.t1
MSCTNQPSRHEEHFDSEAGVYVMRCHVMSCNDGHVRSCNTMSCTHRPGRQSSLVHRIGREPCDALPARKWRAAVCKRHAPLQRTRSVRLVSRASLSAGCHENEIRMVHKAVQDYNLYQVPTETNSILDKSRRTNPVTEILGYGISPTKRGETCSPSIPSTAPPGKPPADEEPTPGNAAADKGERKEPPGALLSPEKPKAKPKHKHKARTEEGKHFSLNVDEEHDPAKCGGALNAENAVAAVLGANALTATRTAVGASAAGQPVRLYNALLPPNKLEDQIRMLPPNKLEDQIRSRRTSVNRAVMGRTTKWLQ